MKTIETANRRNGIRLLLCLLPIDYFSGRMMQIIGRIETGAAVILSAESKSESIPNRLRSIASLFNLFQNLRNFLKTFPFCQKNVFRAEKFCGKNVFLLRQHYFQWGQRYFQSRTTLFFAEGNIIFTRDKIVCPIFNRQSRWNRTEMESKANFWTG